MNDHRKTKKQIMDELASLRSIVVELEAEKAAPRGEDHEFGDSAEQYRLLTQHSLSGIYIHRELRLVYVNQRFADMLGYTPEEMIGKQIGQFVHPEDRALVEERSTARAQGQSVVPQYEFRMKEKHGKTKWVEVLATTVTFKGTKANMGNLVDISKRKLAENELRRAYENLERRVRERTAEIRAMNEKLLREIDQRKQTEADLIRTRETAAQDANKLRSMIEGMDEGVVIADAQDIITDVNGWFLDRFRIRRQDAVGKPIWDLHPESSAVKRVRRLVSDCKNLIRRDTFVVNRELLGLHVSLRVQPVIEGDLYKGVVLNLIDITDLKQAEQKLRQAHDDLEKRVQERTAELSHANELLKKEIRERLRTEEELRQSEERFRALFENAPDCIFVKDKILRYTHVNPSMADLFELPVSRIVGKTDEQLFGQPAASHLREVDSRVVLGEFIEEEHTRPVNGRLITFLDIRMPMRSKSGEIVGLYGISRNITERRRMRLPASLIRSDEYPSHAMRTVFHMARVAAQKDGIILLLGESGSGKDYLARYIHDHSRRSNNPYYTLNCAALPPELAESELFGHEAGAFTGARGRKRGLVEMAEGGTLLLNEVGELPLPLQAKLLTFLDTRSFTRVGGERPVSVNARILAATNRDLENELRQGRFRHDLYYRLNVLCLRVPPLRERMDDLPNLVDRIMEALAVEMQLPERPTVDQATQRALQSYKWPGNVRELRNVLERALMLWESGPIKLATLGSEVHGEEWTHVVRFPNDGSLTEVAREVKQSLCLEALRRSNGNKAEAARMLGITRYSLLRVLKTLQYPAQES
jgi:PAS domain S-box-containing protein